jgi:hypothetical protein
MSERLRWNANRRGPFWAGIAASGLLAACPSSKTPPAIEALPELPAELARDLAVGRTAPVLMTSPSAATTTKPPALHDGGAIFAIARACTTYDDGYVLYPMTVCYPPTDLYEKLVVGAVEARAPHPDRKVQPSPTRYFKLSSHPLVGRGGPWFCTTRSGPWYAHVVGQQLCGVDPNIRVFHADILGAPQTVVVNWTGALTDVPPPLNLFGISPSSPETCVCCSGVTCPNGNCAPDLQHCGVGPPAVHE